MRSCRNCRWWEGEYVNLKLEKKCHSVLANANSPPRNRPLFTGKDSGAECKFFVPLPVIDNL